MVKTGTELYKAKLVNEKGDFFSLFIYTDETGTYNVHKYTFDGLIVFKNKKIQNIKKWLERYCEMNNCEDVTTLFLNNIAETKQNRTGAQHHNQYS